MFFIPCISGSYLICKEVTSLTMPKAKKKGKKKGGKKQDLADQAAQATIVPHTPLLACTPPSP
jgi:hypothetical protein